MISEQVDATAEAMQSRRISAVIIAVAAALSLVSLHNFLEGFYRTAAVMLATVLLLGVVFHQARIGKRQSATILLWVLTAAATATIWLDQGLHDQALIGYAGTLVFCGVLGGGRHFFLLLAFIVVSIVCLGTLNVLGIYVNEIKPVRIGNIVDAVLTIGAVGFAGLLLTRDQHRLIRKLKVEIQRVHESQKAIKHLANHDTLTGLPNRLLARSVFNETLIESRCNNEHVAMLFLDLDNFKTINDSLGHPAGDELLRQVSDRLKQNIRGHDSVSRQGGDEFLITIGGIKDRAQVANIAVTVLERLNHPFSVMGQQVYVSCSLGLSIAPDDSDDFDILLKNADTAMYIAKDRGRNGWQSYNEEMSRNLKENLRLATDLRGAIDSQQLVMHYQPKFELKTGNLVGAEALLRWEHPTLGMIYPDSFIFIAEKTGLITEIGAWVLQEACFQAAKWHQQGFAHLHVSVNLSPVQFQRGDLEAIVVDALSDTGLPARALELELTESLFIEKGLDVSGVLHRLREHGVRFSIDDFGTGYSNLGYLTRFKVETLKIDRSFISRLTHNSHDEAVVRAITQMAHGLNMLIVAEGIEDESTLERLRLLGCDKGQGYFWAGGLSPDEFNQFLLETAGDE